MKQLVERFRDKDKMYDLMVETAGNLLMIIIGIIVAYFIKVYLIGF